MEFTVALDSPFNLDYTLDSGQVFRWERWGEWWQGVVYGALLRVKQESDVLRCHSSSEALGTPFVTRYFRLEESLDDVLGSLSKDAALVQAVQRYYGMRLIRQDRWECLASFVLATNANIPRIRKMVANVSSRFGKPFEFEGKEFHAFPTPESLAEASAADLDSCGLGYRSRFLSKVASSIVGGQVDFSELALYDYEEARDKMLRELFGEKLLLGVGPKVADCVLLYSLGKDEAFPIDVWIARALARSYPRLVQSALGKSRLEADSKFTRGEYEKLSSKLRKHFGRFAGYAQLYLYANARAELSSSAMT